MSKKLKALDMSLTCVGAVLFAAAIATLGPALETQFFPVYSTFEIASIKETPDGGSEVVFRYTKKRDCNPAGITWFIGDPGGAYRQVELLSTRPQGSLPVNKPLGQNLSAPYKIDVAPTVLVGQGFANIYNNCHPFWITRSAIYP